MLHDSRCKSPCGKSETAQMSLRNAEDSMQTEHQNKNLMHSPNEHEIRKGQTPKLDFENVHSKSGNAYLDKLRYHKSNGPQVRYNWLQAQRTAKICHCILPTRRSTLVAHQRPRLRLR